MKNQFVTYEIAKKLKELGFDETTIHAYIGGKLFVNKVNVSNNDYTGYDHFIELDEFYENWNKKGWVFAKDGSECFGCKLDNVKYFEACSAPLWQQAIDWLRENKKLEVVVFYKKVMQAYQYDILNMDNGQYNGAHAHGIKTYNEAREAAILKALELIKP